MAFNKVLFPDKTVAIDLTQDTVTEETLAKGVIAHDKQGKQIVGVAEFGVGDNFLQSNKTVIPKNEEQIILADNGYDGLKQVTVKEVPTEFIEIKTNGTFYPSKEDIFIRGVDVKVGEGNVNLIPLQINSNKVDQVFLPSDYEATGFNRVSVNKFIPLLENITITTNGEFTPNNRYDGFGKVIVNIDGENIPNLIEVSAEPSLTETVLLPSLYNADGFNKVTVKKVLLKDYSFKPKQITETYTATDEEGNIGFNKITIEAVTSDIDDNIKPENIKAGVQILNVLGTYIPSIEEADLSATTLLPQYALKGFNYYNKNGKLVSGEMQFYNGKYTEVS